MAKKIENPDVVTLPAVSLSVAHVKAVNGFADGYFASLGNIKKLSTELDLAKLGKLANVQKMGKMACDLATSKAGAFDTSLALAYYDAADQVFCNRMVQDDAKNRQQPGSTTLPEARKLVDIDRSYPVLRSTVRQAIAHGHKVTATESKKELEAASGKANGRKPQLPGDEPTGKNVAQSVISKMTPKLTAQLNAIAVMVNDGLTAARQDELASMILDTLEAFNAPKAEKLVA